MSAVAAPAPIVPPRGESGSRLRTPVLVGAFAVGLLVLLLLAVLFLAAKKPAKARPPCSFGKPCTPPAGPRVLRGTVYRSSLGYTVEYPSEWKVSQKSGDQLVLSANDFDAVLIVAGRKGTDYKGLFDDTFSSLKSRFNLVQSNDPNRTVLGPNVGYQQGVGQDYCGNLTTSQGGSVPVDAIEMAATKDGVSAAVAYVSTDCKKTDNDRKSPNGANELAAGDAVLNSFRWPSEAK